MREIVFHLRSTSRVKWIKVRNSIRL